MIQDYTDLANFLISYSKDPCEVFISGNTHEQVTAKDSRLSGVEINSSLGAGIRVIHKGKLGFAFTQEMTKEGFKKALLTAQVIARNKGEPAQIKEFPKTAKYKKPKAFDKKTFDLEITEEIPEFSSVVESLKSQNKNVHSVDGNLSKMLTNWGIINSSGIKAYDKMTHNYAVFGCTMNGKRKSYYGWGESRIKNSDIDMNKISNLVIERATQIMNPVNPPAGKYDLVFDSRFFKTILNSCVLSAFNGSLANVNKRYTSGKLGKKVFSDLLTIKENPNIEYGVGSAGCDTEGIPTKAKILVSKGVVNKFVYTLNDAKKYKTIPTGNSFRESFNVEPHVSFTNLEVSPGKDKVDNIISRTKKGILVYDAMGLHGFNPISGDFALTISDGVMIRDGTLSESVTGLSFAGKIYDLLSNIDTVSKERDQILNFLVPWVSFKSIPMA